MNSLLATIGIVCAALITGAVTWLVAKRSKSGAINTSEAATLWDEGTKMRVELRDEVTLLKAQLADAITAVTELNREIKASRSETERAREETRKSRAETRQLMAQIEQVHGEVKTSNALTMGALADNTETRRILDIPREQRTTVEQQHLATAGDRLPTDQRPDVGDNEEDKS